jgi:single-stranded DNA-binding protein
MSTMTKTAPKFVTVIGTFGRMPVERITNGGHPVANSVLFDNNRPEGQRAVSLVAYGSAIAKMKEMEVGDLVMVRGRIEERTWTNGGKSGTETVVTLANSGTKVLSKKGAGKPQQGEPEQKAAAPSTETVAPVADNVTNAPARKRARKPQQAMPEKQAA